MRVLVTGGGGFLGGAIVRRLVARGDQVRSFARGEYPKLVKLGVEVRRGDLCDSEAVAAAIQGCERVFHVAALPGVWGAYKDYYRTNVVGTDNVLAACRAQGVKRLVYTSTPSVVHAGGDIEGGDESLPYATKFSAHYPRTKAIAEQSVLRANGEKLCTVALRPHLIWGPGDNHLTPRILARGRANRLRLIGKRPNLISRLRDLEASLLQCNVGFRHGQSFFERSQQHVRNCHFAGQCDQDVVVGCDRGGQVRIR